MKETVIPREEAVFWMDRNGVWHNRHGRFEHKKIIEHFHRSIRKDKDGYHLFQRHGDDLVEKVYFRYEDTPLFVFDVHQDNEEISLVLNTGKRIVLIPENLFVENDALYIDSEGERVKFTDRAMLKIAKRLSYENGKYRFRVGERWQEIRK